MSRWRERRVYLDGLEMRLDEHLVDGGGERRLRGRVQIVARALLATQGEHTVEVTGEPTEESE